MLDSWATRFADLSYRGQHFLPIRKGSTIIASDANETFTTRPIQPTHVKLGPWLRYLWKEGADNPLVARFSRAVLDHAPIGSYRAWIRATDDPSCPCGQTTVESREHILLYCPRFSNRVRPLNRMIEAEHFIKFLVENPHAFSFAASEPQE